MKKQKKNKKIARKAKKQDIKRYYDAAQSSVYHKVIRGGGNNADSVNHSAVTNLRAWSRYLDENHDLAIGIFDNLVNRIVGAGLTIEPVVKNRNKRLNVSVNDQLRDLWLEFWERPEVTGELPGHEVERLICRTWLRDGEALTNHKMGRIPSLQHNSRVPYSLELLEADLLPMDLNDDNIIHGVEKNAWGRPLAYHLYKSHPGNTIVPFQRTAIETKRVSADFITHLKLARRFRQTRGVPLMHGIIHRLDDIKDYSESERIKARVNAAFTAYIKRSPDYDGTVDENGNVPFEMQSGIIFDGLAAGEELGSVGTDTPNPNLGPFIAEMMRAAAAGTGTSYSSVSKHYDGTYSAQRQELVESIEGYKSPLDYFIGVQIMPIWRNFIDMVILNRLFTVPRNVDIRALYRAVEIRGPGIPWIDPKKEAEADGIAVENGFKSRHQVIRERGGDPRLVDQELAADTFEKPVAAESVIEEPENSEADDSEETEAA
jgi:lambda family phage portal protein